MARHSSVPLLGRAPRPTQTRLAACVPLLVSALVLAAIAAIGLLPFSYRVAVGLGLIQGLSEFLPISSSAT